MKYINASNVSFVMKIVLISRDQKLSSVDNFWGNIERKKSVFTWKTGGKHDGFNVFKKKSWKPTSEFTQYINQFTEDK
ncbi:unnamed protein product [Rhizophagus irregularis]|nr:unnamed protein product [Rhizophagus irregularis]